MSEAKYCILKEGQKPVTITLKVESDLNAGSDFKLFDPKTKEVIEQFKLNSNSSKPGVHKITTDITKLNGLKLNFMILICSKNPNNFKGKVSLLINQAAMPAKLTSPVSYLLQNIPPCSHGSTEKIQGSLFFVVNKDTRKHPVTGLPIG